ncbi:MAG: DUF5691 domain-containing protein, partial [Planctomycetota bacterium]
PEPQIKQIIQLFANRGYVVHPMDYMPMSFDQLPNVYSPWESWQKAGNEDVEASGIFDTINVDNWDEWMPAERRLALTRLRCDQPETSRELIAEKLPSLPAEERFRIIEALAAKVNRDDQAFLEGFVKDRSTKVRQLVAQCLARIGISEDDPEEVTEFADFFSVAKKRLKGGVKVTANRIKMRAQRKRRNELAKKLSLRGLTTGLELPNESELISGWQHVDDEASDAFVRMVAATGSEQSAAELAARLVSLDGISAEAFEQLFDRLGTSSRRELMPHVLQNDDASFVASVICAQGFWGEVTLPQLESLRALKELKKLAGEDHSAKTGRLEVLRQGLFSLGLLVDQSAANNLLKSFTDTNLFAADPMLGLLKLNASLPSGDPS